jgi:MFS family permease
MASQRSWAIAAVCFGLAMAGFSGNMISVALPSIGSDLRISDSQLAQVISVYVAASGGALLVAGRLGDAFGHQRMFALGVCVFALASLGCGLATSAGALVAWRAAQGVGGAMVTVLAQCVAANLFVEQTGRTRVLGLFTLIGTSNACVGLTIGAALLSVLDWRWIFLLDVPIGAVSICILAVLPKATHESRKRFDIRGTALAIVLLAPVACVLASDQQSMWRGMWPSGLIVGAIVLVAGFVWWRLRVQATIVRTSIARMTRIAVVNAIAVMHAVAIFTWSFACTLYLQRVLEFTPAQVGLLYLPAIAGASAAALTIVPPLVARLGVQPPAVIGLLGMSIGLALLWRMPVDAFSLYDIVPGLLLVGIGSGISYTPLIHAALRDAGPDRVGAASGLINTSYMLGGALGLSALGSIAAERTTDLIAAGVDGIIALSDGYRMALGLSAVVSFAAAVIGAAALRNELQPGHTRV